MTQNERTRARRRRADARRRALMGVILDARRPEADEGASGSMPVRRRVDHWWDPAVEQRTTASASKNAALDKVSAEVSALMLEHDLFT